MGYPAVYPESQPEIPDQNYPIPYPEPQAYQSPNPGSQSDAVPDQGYPGEMINPAAYPYRSPGPDSGIQSSDSSEAAQTNAEIAQSMGLIPIDMSYAFAQSCVLCAHGIPHPTVDDLPQLMDGSWYNNVKSEHFNTIVSFLQP